MRLIFKRFVAMCTVVIIATFLLSLLMRLLPGDPAAVLVPNAPDQVRDVIRQETGLSKGIFGYYWQWLSGMLTGDFGKYYLNGGYRTVASVLQRCLPPSLYLIMYSQIVALVIAIPLGLTSAYKEGSRFDRITSSVLFTTVSVPAFALGLILSLIFAVQLGWVDPIGYESPFGHPWQHFKLMILPVISLSVGLTSSYTRLLRTDVIATLKEDYVTMAASKGISNRRVLWKHVFRPSSTTLLTSAALNMGGLIGGTIIVETIFVIPGIGYEIAYSIGARQIIAMQTLIALVSFAYVFFNTAVDLLTNLTDPRTRERRG
ncbi:MAG: ABC transporter permease [Actinobacteria bacterium]|nr:ABC transporter permease [Actinomycetota bacterium]